ncbi:MAG: FAD-binding oxidoreductase [Chloroflexales bacterium]|nr:FAD-binding oxidoreductase [Chloroflexales bacterium]
MTLKKTPLWIDGITFPNALYAIPDEVEVVIIGGGLTGLAAARELARQHISVAVLEARYCGWGASSRNGGMVLTGLKLDVQTLTNKYGMELARRFFAASLAAIDCVEQIVQDEAIACDFARSGHLYLAAKPSHITMIKRDADLLGRAFDHTVSWRSGADLCDEIGSQAFYGGLVDPISARIDPARYVAGLIRAAHKADAYLCNRATVQHIERQNGFFYINTSRGVLRAKAVFIATGGYTGSATPLLQRRIVPLGSYSIATEVLTDSLAQELSPRNRMFFDSKHLLYYFRLTPDQRLLFGGRAGFLPETPATLRQSAAILRRGMLRVFPQLHNTRIDYAWGGVLDVTFDQMPHTGQIDGMFYALGYAGHGVALATYLGTLMARQIAGTPSDNPFSTVPIPNAPLGLYNGRTWFLPLVGAWYQFLDWIS